MKYRIIEEVHYNFKRSRYICQQKRFLFWRTIVDIMEGWHYPRIYNNFSDAREYMEAKLSHIESAKGDKVKKIVIRWTPNND